MKSYIQLIMMVLFFVYGATAYELFPTMSKGELLRDVKCISESQNQTICNKDLNCDTKFPPQIAAAFQKCTKEVNPDRNLKCDENTTLYPSIETVSRLYDCVKQNIVKPSPSDNKQSRVFEDCIRSVYMECLALPKNQ